MKYENIKTFIKSTKSSKSTIDRFYKKNEELWSETQFKNGKGSCAAIQDNDHGFGASDYTFCRCFGYCFVGCDVLAYVSVEQCDWVE